MGKIFAMLLMAGVVWIGVTIHNEGAENAFGGSFSFLSQGEPARTTRSGESISRASRTTHEMNERLRADQERFDEILAD